MKEVVSVDIFIRLTYRRKFTYISKHYILLHNVYPLILYNSNVVFSSLLKTKQNGFYHRRNANTSGLSLLCEVSKSKSSNQKC